MSKTKLLVSEPELSSPIILANSLEGNALLPVAHAKKFKVILFFFLSDPIAQSNQEFCWTYHQNISRIWHFWPCPVPSSWLKIHPLLPGLQQQVSLAFLHSLSNAVARIPLLKHKLYNVVPWLKTLQCSPKSKSCQWSTRIWKIWLPLTSLTLSVYSPSLTHLQPHWLPCYS